MNRRLGVLFFPAALLFSACGQPTSDEARKKLAERNVPVNEQALLAKTKEGKSGEADARLLAAAGVDPNARQANGMTALMSAAYNGQREVAEVLIAKGAEVNATAAGFTALRLAVEKNDANMVALLLKAGARPGLKADGAPSALEKAEQGRNQDIIDLLKKAGP